MHGKHVRTLVLSLALVAGWTLAQDVSIDPPKAAQLKRMEPLTSEKIDVFVQAGQLTQQQADFVRKYVDAAGTLNLPASAVRAEPRALPPTPAPAPVSQQPMVSSPPVVSSPPPAQVAQRPMVSGDSGNLYARFGYNIAPADRDRLMRLIANFRHGNRNDLAREIRKARPPVNELIAPAYTDPIDLPIKIELWKVVAGPSNPDACWGLFETHRAAFELARPVLIPYAKDVGGIIVRRKRTTPDANAQPAERWFTSRELRDLIIDTEGLLSRCAGPNAAIFLLDVYSQRYNEGESPMRDDGRDWRRMVDVCGGDPKKFDDDDHKTWHSTLNASQRAAIIDAVLPWLNRSNGDRRRIARATLLTCAQTSHHPDWDAGQSQWERWWESYRQKME